MTQIATVEKILPGGFVEISVPRKSACGHDCEECAGCGMTGAAIHARAKDPVGVRPGQKVVVESATRKILGVVALVYLLPVVGFLLGYFLSAGLELLLYSVSLAFCWGSCVRLLWTGITGRAGGLRSALLPFREPGCRCSAMCVLRRIG